MLVFEDLCLRSLVCFLSYLFIYFFSQPMLGQITKDLGDAMRLLSFKEFQADFKYDGVRAQIHLDSQGRVSVFSRHLENSTQQWPDAIEQFRRALSRSVTDIIIDAEIVAFDRLSQR